MTGGAAGAGRRVLVLDGSDGEGGAGWALVAVGAGGAAELVRAGEVAGRDGAGLASVLRRALDAAGWRLEAGMLLAVVTGPGSFTGLRATLALAHGLATGSGAALVGVSAGEAMLPELAGHAAGAVWWVSRARKGRVFVEDGETVRSVALDRLPDLAGGGVTLGGNGAAEAAGAIGPVARVVAGTGRIDAAAVARAALRRCGGGVTAGPVLPLYVDAPEAVPMAGRVG